MGCPREVIRCGFTDSLTRDIRGVSFSHARWSPGTDSTKASGLQADLTEASEHLSSADTTAPDTAHDFTGSGAHKEDLHAMPTSMCLFPPFLEPYASDLHVCKAVHLNNRHV